MVSFVVVAHHVWTSDVEAYIEGAYAACAFAVGSFVVESVEVAFGVGSHGWPVVEVGPSAVDAPASSVGACGGEGGFGGKTLASYSGASLLACQDPGPSR